MRQGARNNKLRRGRSEKKKKKFEWLSRKTCEQNISFGLEANGLSKHEIESIETESILGTVAYGSEGRPVR